MRTTLKKGLGRQAALNGNGRAVLPPGVLTPVTRYRQPAPGQRGTAYWVGRILLILVVAALMAAGALAGGLYLWAHDSIGATAPKTKDEIRGSRRLDPLPSGPNRPAIALVVGYDHRLGANTAGPSRSDTVMLSVSIGEIVPRWCWASRC